MINIKEMRVRRYAASSRKSPMNAQGKKDAAR